MLTSAQLRKLAAQAQIDERTAVRWLAGLPVRSGSASRLAAAWAQLGWTLSERTAWPSATLKATPAGDR